MVKYLIEVTETNKLTKEKSTYHLGKCGRKWSVINPDPRRYMEYMDKTYGFDSAENAKKRIKKEEEYHTWLKNNLEDNYISVYNIIEIEDND